MPFNGSGMFTRLFNFVTDRNNNIRIQATRMDQEFDGIAAGLSNCLTKDGQTQPSGNIPMNGKRITNLGDATTDTDALNRRTADARYLTADDTVTWSNPQTFSDDVTFSTGFTATFNGKVNYTGVDFTITNAIPQITFVETGSVTRKILQDGGIIGFRRSNGTWALQVDDAGKVTATGDVTGNSDIRFKEAIDPLDPDEAVLLVQMLARACARYTLKADGARHVGMIAQLVQPFVPEAVGETKDGLTLAYANLVAVLFPALARALERIEALEAR